MAVTKNKSSVPFRGDNDAEKFLTHRQLQCLSMYAVEGLSQSEIAGRLGINQRVVSQHIAAGRKKIEAAGLKISTRRPTARNDKLCVAPATLDAISESQIRAIW